MKKTLSVILTGIVSTMAVMPLSAGGTVEKVGIHTDEAAADTTITLQEVSIRSHFAN